MDIFGFKTQGINYDKFRPKYPPIFIDHYLKTIKNKNRYLDIATGTGQLLFVFAQHFQYSRGIDLSKNMIETAQQKCKEFKEKYPEREIDLKVEDVMGLDESQKYDFITVGQALHFFPIESALDKIKKMLRQDGTFVTFGYILNRVQGKQGNEEAVFSNYYKKVKPLFTFDRDDLHSHYSDKNKYPFEKLFPRVEREVVELPLQMNKLEYLSYLKTMSGYNLYLQQGKDDPIMEVDSHCGDEVTLIFDYFRIDCSLQ